MTNACLPVDQVNASTSQDSDSRGFSFGFRLSALRNSQTSFRSLRLFEKELNSIGFFSYEGRGAQAGWRSDAAVSTVTSPRGNPGF